MTRHLAVIEEGEIRPGQMATAAIDVDRRAAIRRNHTGTHLLHWALREVLGDHVKQQGSLVGPDRLRFDFTHYGPLSAEETARIEDLVNEQVLADEDVAVARDDARTTPTRPGAIAFFEDKYGDEVRVVQAGSESLELCGGTHVARLGQIGPLEIVSEGSIGSNLRRIFATTGTATLARLRQVGASARRRGRPAAGQPGRADRRPSSASWPTSATSKAGSARPSRPPWPARPGPWSSEAVDGWLVARADGLTTDQLQELANQVRQLGGLQTVVLGGSPDGTRAALVAWPPRAGR